MKRKVAFLTLQRIMFRTANEKKKFLDGPRAPRTRLLKSVGALGTRINSTCPFSSPEPQSLLSLVPSLRRLRGPGGSGDENDSCPMIAARDNRFVYKVMHVAFSLSLVKIAVQDTDANGRYLHKTSYNTSSGAVYIT